MVGGVSVYHGGCVPVDHGGYSTPPGMPTLLYWTPPTLPGMPTLPTPGYTMVHIPHLGPAHPAAHGVPLPADGALGSVWENPMGEGGLMS